MLSKFYVCLVNFVLVLFSKIRMVLILIVSVNGIFINKTVTSNKIKKLSFSLIELISSINLDMSLMSIYGKYELILSKIIVVKTC